MRGRPFKKGESGNAGGRPKVIAELRALARAHAPDAADLIEAADRHVAEGALYRALKVIRTLLKREEELAA